MKSRFCLAVALSMLARAAAAQDLAPEPGPDKLPLWEVGVIGGAVSTPAYPAASERNNRVLALPYLIYRGEVFRSDANGIGARLFHSDLAEFDLGLAASLPAKSNDVVERRGMPDLGLLAEFGPQLKILLARPNPNARLRLELPLRAVIEAHAGLRTQGMAFEPRLAYEDRNVVAGWSGGVSLSAVFGNTRLNRYFFEVAPQYATPERPAFDARAGLILTRLGVSAAHDLNPDLKLYAFARYENYARAASRASPLFRKNSGSSAGLALAWTFAQAGVSGK